MANNTQYTSKLEGLDHPDLFTRNEWEVVTYIKENKEYVSHMSIGELAEVTYSSNSSIIRICRKLNCDGFKELKLRLVQDVENQKYIKDEIDFSFPFHVGESTVDIIANMSSLYRNAIDAIQSALDPIKLNEIARYLSHANRVYVYGIGDSQTTISGFANKAIKSGITAIVATQNNEQVYASHNANKNDCALFISYSGNSAPINDCLAVLKKNHVPIVCVTATKDSQLYKMSDMRILIPNLEGKTEEKIATFYSQFAFSYILDVLYALSYNAIKHK